MLKSDAYALVNTVNCEGYMGKGIAYQFKLLYPEMNSEYVKKCKRHEITPGKLHCFREKNKLIINFPTKNSWREKSKMEYIYSGLDSLIKVIQEYNITSIAIPPLGSGNGGLIWNEVRQVIEQKLKSISNFVDIYIYEPSHNYKAVSTVEPKLSLSALILMNIKFKIDSNLFGEVTLQKTAYFMNVLSNTDYFHFKRAKYGPFDHSITVVSKDIKAFQNYHSVDTQKAYDVLLQKLISESIQGKLNFYLPFIEIAADFTNKLRSKEAVEGAGTALFIIQERKSATLEDIIWEFKHWQGDKAERFSEQDIEHAVLTLEKNDFINNTFYPELFTEL